MWKHVERLWIICGKNVERRVIKFLIFKGFSEGRSFHRYVDFEV